MKKNVIALLMSVVLASGSMGGVVPAMAAEAAGEAVQVQEAEEAAPEEDGEEPAEEAEARRAASRGP